MSGGSYDYAYTKVEDLSREVVGSSPLRRAFKEHLKKVATALHDIEWVDSGDYGPGREEEAIRACLGPEAELAQVVKEAKEIKTELERLLQGR